MVAYLGVEPSCPMGRVLQTPALTVVLIHAMMVPPVRVERTSEVFQAPAVTTLATAAYQSGIERLSARITRNPEIVGTPGRIRTYIDNG